MVKLVNSRMIRNRKAAIKAVMEAMLPEFLNRIFLRWVGLMTYEPPKMIEYSTTCVHLGSNLDIINPSKVEDNDPLLFHYDNGPDSDNGEQEDVSDYCEGGYYVVNIGDFFQGRYHVIRKLGWGHSSTVWLAWDLHEKSYVALKIVKSAPHFIETAVDEMKLLRTIHTSDPSDSGYSHVVQLLDDFKIDGIHGSHICMVFEVLGHNLLEFVIKSSYEGISIPMAKAILKQTLMGLNYLHTKCQVIHTDIKPENILVCISHEDVQRIANTAAVASQHGKLGKSFMAMAPEDVVLKQTERCQKMSTKKKEKLKQKIKKQIKAHRKEVSSHVDDSTRNISEKDERGTEFARKTKFERPRSSVTTNPTSFRDNLSAFLNNTSVKVKLADLGNACWINHHFTEEIQTRQYRSLEVLLGSGYGPPADIWSTACMAFELLTGDFLFEPHSGKNYSRDEDHLALIIELLGRIPRRISLSGKYSKDYFDKKGELRHIKRLKPWSLKAVLMEKYDWSEKDSTEVAQFLEPMLSYRQEKRYTAAQCLESTWLNTL